MFSTLKPSQMNVSETLDLCRGFKTSFESHCHEDAYLLPIYNRIVAGIQIAEELQGRSRTNPHSQALQEFRVERRLIISGMNDILSGKVKMAMLDSVAANSAKILLTINDETPIQFSGPLMKTHNQVNTRIRRLSVDVNEMHMKNTGLFSAFEYLIKVQGKIDDALKNKDAAASTKVKGKVDSQITALKNEIGYVLPYLESSSISQPKIYLAPAKEIAETVARVMTAVHMRLNRKADDPISVAE